MKDKNTPRGRRLTAPAHPSEVGDRLAAAPWIGLDLLTIGATYMTSQGQRVDPFCVRLKLDWGGDRHFHKPSGRAGCWACQEGIDAEMSLWSFSVFPPKAL